MLIVPRVARGAPLRSVYDHAEAYAQIAVGVVAIEFDVPASEVLSVCRKPQVVRVRQLAMYLLHVLFRLNVNRVGRALGRDRSTVCHALRVIEDARDDFAFDERVLAIEQALQSLPELEPPRPPGRPRKITTSQDVQP